MTVIPSDKGRTAEDVAEVFPGKAERAILRRSGGEYHGIVQLLQFGNLYIASYRDVAHEAHIVCQRSLLITAHHAFDRLVIRRHPGSN